MEWADVSMLRPLRDRFREERFSRSECWKASIESTRSMSLREPAWMSTAAAGDVGEGVVATRVPACERQVSKERPKHQRERREVRVAMAWSTT